MVRTVGLSGLSRQTASAFIGVSPDGTCIEGVDAQGPRVTLAADLTALQSAYP